MTKAIIIKKPGGPEVLEIKDIELAAPGPDQIKVKNIAIGLNYIDTYHRSGLYPVPLPSGIGLEGAGKITEIGSNVKDLNIGDIAKPIKSFEKAIFYKLSDKKILKVKNLDLEKLKKNIIIQKQNELLNFYSANHLSKIKNNSLIEYK